MGAFWIITAILCVSAWESAGITNKGRPLLQDTLLRNFRHVPGPSASVNTDWEVGLREAVNQALLRERYHDYNLRERLLEAPLIGRQEAVTPFGDIVILARGQLYVTQGGNFLFIQDQYQNDCEACHNPRPRCGSTHCQTWRPEENEHLVALWTVKRLRHRNHNNGYYYELEYIVSPISPSIKEFVVGNGHFDYGIPGHIFIVRNNQAREQPEHAFVNRRLPQPHFKPEVIIGISANGDKHVLQSYPGFYTSFPVHPTYHHHHRYSTNDPREIELYKELIESLAARTSSTQKTETGPHKFSLNGYTEATTIQVQSTKPSYESFPTTHDSMVELSTKPLSTTTMVRFPETTEQHSTITKPTSMAPTKPTDLSTQEIFDTPKPITTIHYFTPIGEEDVITDGITEMQKITLGTVTKEPEETGSDFLFPETETTSSSKTTTNYYKLTTLTKGITKMKNATLGIVTKDQEETGTDFLFPKTETTLPSKTTTKQYYKPTTIAENVPNSLEEPSSSSSKTTKQYETSVTRTKPTTTKTTTTKTTTTKTTTLKPTTTRSTTMTTRRRPSATKTRPSKPTTTKFKAPKPTKTTTEALGTTETSTPKITTRKTTTTTINVPSTASKTATDAPSTTTMKTTTVKLRTTKTKLSNLTGFIASTTMGTKKITTYKPKFTTTKLTTTTKLATPETTSLTTQAKETTQQRTTVAMAFTRPTRPQRPMIDLDYTLLEDISPTEPMKMTSLKPEETQPQSLSTITTMTNTTIPYTTTITVSETSNEFTTQETTTTKRRSNASTSTTKAISTTEGIITTTEPTQTSTISRENGTDSAATSRDETEATTQGTTKTTLPDSDEVSIVFSTDTTRNEHPTTITTTFKAETIAITSETTPQLIESTTTSRKPTVTKSKPSTTTDDFLTEDGNMEKPSFTKPDKVDIDEYDIFGSTKPQTKPTKSTTVKIFTESDLASALFGSREEKVLEEPDTTPFKGTKIIYSNFFEASTTPLPDTTQYTTQTENYETTTNFKPLTSQSYATSISFQVKENNDTSAETENNTTLGTTMAVDKPTESTVTTTKENKPETRKAFDRAALQLVNHAKSIDYLNGGSNKTSRAKYKRRKTYVPKNRRLNRKQVT